MFGRKLAVFLFTLVAVPVILLTWKLLGLGAVLPPVIIYGAGLGILSKLK